MINVKIENASRENHHTVRLTPANGERVDPTTLKGAAIWDDELRLCLAPVARDLTCRGTDEIATFTTVPETFRDWEMHVNDVNIGVVGDTYEDGPSPHPLIVEEVLIGDQSVFRFENISSECIRVDLSYNGDVQPDMFVLAEASQGVHHEILEVPGSNGWMYYQIHLGPTRLNSVSLDFSFNSDTETNISQTFGGSVDFRISTTNLLPSEGLTFTVEGETYTLKKGEKELNIPFTIPPNPTNYPIYWTPEIEILNPEYLLGDEMPELGEITILPTGFKYGAPVTIVIEGYGTRTFNASEHYPSASYYMSQDILRVGANSEVTLHLDPSFAGAELRMDMYMALNPYLGKVDETGTIKFRLPSHLMIRKEESISLTLHDEGNPSPFFSIYALTGVGSRLSMSNEYFSTNNPIHVTMSKGYGEEVLVYNIPAEIDEIELFAYQFNDARADVTPFHIPKRVKRGGDGQFRFVPDKPARAYNSDAGGYLYRVNYFGAAFVIDGMVTNYTLWVAVQLKVGAG